MYKEKLNKIEFCCVKFFACLHEQCTVVQYTIRLYIIIRVHSGFSLVENRDVLRDRRLADAILLMS